MNKKPYPNYVSANPVLSDYTDLDIFKGKSFLEFNDLIGRPMKNDIEHPIYDYEIDLVNKIENNRNIWIKKASGIGCTELVLRYLLWKILVNDNLRYKNIFICSGTFVHHANEIKVRMENLFRRKFPRLQFNSKFTQLQVKDTLIKIFPSRNVKDLRGYTDVSYLFIDEADHFEKSVNSELLHAITRYEEKSKCTTIMVSTPNAPGGLFESIELDKNSKYCKIYLGYQVGLGKIFDPIEIEKKKSEPEFEREYNLKYTGRQGNTFNSLDIEQSIKRFTDLGIDKIPIESNKQVTWIGLDPASGSSNTGIVATQRIIVTDPITNRNKDVIRIVFADEYVKPSAKFIIDLCHDLRRMFGTANTYFFVDNAATMLCRDLRISVDENPEYDVQTVSPQSDHIIPVVFTAQSSKEMLSNLEHLLNKGYLAINPKYDKVLTSLRTAYSTEWKLDKEITVSDDSLDALRLSCKGYNIRN